MAITRDYALSVATEVAQLICKGASKLANMPTGDLPLLARLPLIRLTSMEEEEISDANIGTIVPDIYDVLIFGSVARGEERVGDVDMMAVDTGFFSNFLGGWGFESKGDGAILSEFLESWCKIPEAQRPAAKRVKLVDLFFLPRRFFEEPEWRRKFVDGQSDPDFLKNAFSSLLRYKKNGFSPSLLCKEGDEEQGQWVPTTIQDLEEEYGVCLDDLRR